MSLIEDRVDELIKMLKSSDTDDRDLAFTIMEAQSKITDYAYIKYIKKESKVFSSLWSVNAPKTSGYITLFTDDTLDEITFSEILRGIGYNKDLSDEQKNSQAHFIVTKMNENVLSLLHNHKIKNIKRIDIKFILNETKSKPITE